MKTRNILLAAALMMAAGVAKAQFFVEQNDGGKTVVGSSSDAGFVSGSDGTWTFGGVDISNIKSVTVAPLDDRLAAYQAPEYPDYYRSISGWGDRAKWNLANVHDPSVVRADDGYYYMYTTDASFGNAHSGHGHFMCRRSRNLVDWEFMGATMSRLPQWVKPKLNEIRAAMGLGESTADFTNDELFGYWAPCVRRVKSGLYRMYYAITCPSYIDGDNSWGERAFIGLMETATPEDVASWTDKGYVLTNASDKELDFYVKPDDWANCYFKYNAIDPSYIITPEGAHWLIYGSWHSGFAAVELDAETGMPKKELGMPWGDITAYGKQIYTRQMGNRWQAAEAPEVIWRDGYYYLFMACDELAVAYNTRVVRSRNIDGPYVGMDGTDVTTRGGDAWPLVTHPYRFSQGYGWVGVSHCAVFDDGRGNWFYSSQGRLPADAYGDAYSNAIMQGQVRRILWTEDGWPVVMPECYGGVPQAPISEEELTGEWENVTLEYKYQTQSVATSLTLTADHKVEGTPFGGQTWSFDAATNTLTIGTQKLLLCREADWETSPRAATIVYAGYGAGGKKTYWGKKTVKQAYSTYGPEDNTAPFWKYFTPYLTSASGECTFTYSFRNYTDGAANWNNWLLVLTNGKQREESGYAEYFVLRADAYGWGTYATDELRAAGMTNDYDWTTFTSDMNGAQVDLTLTISSGTAVMTAVTMTATGKKYNYSYTVSGLPAGTKGCFLTMEKAHLVLDNEQCGVGE